MFRPVSTVATSHSPVARQHFKHVQSQENPARGLSEAFQYTGLEAALFL